MEKVALIKCDSYNVDVVEEKLREGFELLGGDSFLRKLVPSGSRVMLKPNLLASSPKGSPVVTHHAVFEGIIRILKDYTENIVFGDSPGIDDAYKVAERAGLIEVADRYGVKFEAFKNTVHVTNENALLCRGFEVAECVAEADVLISLPKLKTHAMAYYTGAVKNQFGCIPGTRKAEWHTRMPQNENFSRMLLDLNSVVKTKFAILDGITAMEGNGPKNGKPKNLDAIVMGECLTAVDSVGARMIGYDNVLDIPMLNQAHITKWGAVLPEEISVVGEKFEDMKVTDFELIRNTNEFIFINKEVTGILKKMLAPNPVLIEDKCVGCRRCEEVCPEKPNVITMVQGKNKLEPKWNMKKCIRCFCCQELCPVGAIKTKYPMIAKIMQKR